VGVLALYVPLTIMNIKENK